MILLSIIEEKWKLIQKAAEDRVDADGKLLKAGGRLLRGHTKFSELRISALYLQLCVSYCNVCHWCLKFCNGYHASNLVDRGQCFSGLNNIEWRTLGGFRNKENDPNNDVDHCCERRC